MSALATSPSGRKIGFVTLGLVVGTTASAAAWHFGWSRSGFAHLAEATPPWVAVSIVIFFAASLSSTVGFAFSAIAAAMIFYFVSDTVEAVKIMMVASIAIQAYCVAGMWRTISLGITATPYIITQFPGRHLQEVETSPRPDLRCTLLLQLLHPMLLVIGDSARERHGAGYAHLGQ